MASDKQDDVFARSEGDQWFIRNLEALENFVPENDLPLKLMQLYGLKPDKVLEIGGANGFRLAKIKDLNKPRRMVVVEPSKDAIRDGQKKYPFIEYHQGLAFPLPLEETFDLIILNFVFHWIDRSTLIRSAAEIDKTLDDKGFLIIGDFFPSNRFKVSYHHLPGQQVHTYKQNYAAIFIASGLYKPVGMLTAYHSNKELLPDVPDADRIGTFILQKDLTGSYTEAVFQPEEK